MSSPLPASLRSRGNEVVLASCAAVFLVAYTYEVLWRPTRGGLLAVEVVIWATWAVFAVDWAVAFHRDRDKRAHRWEHLLGFLVVVLPALEPLRALRLLSLMVFLQRMLVRSSMRMTVLWYAIASSSLLVYVSALAVLQVERDAAGSTIHDLGTALWWAIATVTTVGYGDLTPVTGTGRLVAAALMIGGVALLGIVTATLASWLVERIAEESERVEAREEATLDELRDEVSALRAEIVTLTQAVRGTGPSGDARPGVVGDSATH